MVQLLSAEVSRHTVTVPKMAAHHEQSSERLDPGQRRQGSKRDRHRSNQRAINNEATPLRTHRPTTSFRNARLLALSILLALVSLSFFILPSYYAMDNVHEKDISSESNGIWSRRKISNVGSRAGEVDREDGKFLQTGKVPNKSISQKSSTGMKKGAFQRRKRNRLVRGTHLSLAEMNGWLSLQEVLGSDGKISSHEDISWLLDFAIIGFAKTGTTSMLRHLSEELTHMLPSESCGLADENNGIAKLVKDMYADRSKRLEIAEINGEILDELPRGIKCPQDISSEFSMHNYAKYFPKTKLIVGIRHPVLWFESLYNFRVSNVPWKKMLHTNLLTRGCTFGSQGVCAHRANFADFLSQLDKTPMSDAAELDLLTMGLSPVKTPVGQVFLYDVSQLSNDNDVDNQSLVFRKDLQNFLGLSADIPPFPAIDTSGKFDFLEPIKKQTEGDKIDICDLEHDKIREVLMEKARISSTWIKEYFLQSNDVVVSSRSHFLDVLETWNDDPCKVRRKADTKQS
jgi:hypothetical protein